MNPLKQQSYSELVSARKSCAQAACADLANPAIIARKLDSQHLGPWTWWQGDLNADLLVVGQDFADRETFVRVQGYPGRKVVTNRLLVEYLDVSGIKVCLPNDTPPTIETAGQNRLFLTNAVLCMKCGDMRTKVPSSAVYECGERFLRPTIELVGPTVVATLGMHALRATLCAFGLDVPRRLKPLLVAGWTQNLPNGSLLVPLAHPRSSRSKADQFCDWRRVKSLLDERRNERESGEAIERA